MDGTEEYIHTRTQSLYSKVGLVEEMKGGEERQEVTE
jgi:hypothetical protein